MPADTGLLTVVVPEKATVFVNGYQTKTTGTVRQYLSRGLKPGLSYKYEIRAELLRDGKLLEHTQVVFLDAGGTQSVAISFDPKLREQLAQR